MLVRSKVFPQFVEKIEKLTPNLSKQHNKMLKMRSQMLKIRKHGKIIKLGKISREIPRIFGIPGISRDSWKFFGKFPVSREVENPAKKEILLLSNI